MTLRLQHIEKLKLSAEVKKRGYRRPDQEEIDHFKEFGPIKPVVISASRQSGFFEILAQETTWFAAQALGVHEIPAIEVFPNSDSDRKRLSEIKRNDNVIDTARRYESWLKANPSKSQSDLARLENVDRTLICHKLRLLDLHPEIQKYVEDDLLTAAHAMHLIRLEKSKRLKFARRAIGKKWNSTELKNAILKKPNNEKPRGPKSISVSAKKPSIEKTKDPDTLKLEKQMTEIVGSPVEFDLKTGCLNIDYQGNNDILSGILERLGYRG